MTCAPDHPGVTAEDYVSRMRSAMYATGFFTVDAQRADRRELVRARVLSFARSMARGAFDYDHSGRRHVQDNLYALVLIGTTLRPECDAREVLSTFDDHLYSLDHAQPVHRPLV